MKISDALGCFVIPAEHTASWHSVVRRDTSNGQTAVGQLRLRFPASPTLPRALPTSQHSRASGIESLMKKFENRDYPALLDSNHGLEDDDTAGVLRTEAPMPSLVLRELTHCFHTTADFDRPRKHWYQQSAAI